MLIVIITHNIFSQTAAFLTNEEKAYMYHIVMKSPTLNRNMEYIFNYKGSINEKDSTDFLFIEKQIINEPHLLEIDFSEFKTQSSGVMAELSVKMALWTLYNQLKKGIKETDPELYDPIFKDFIDSLVKRVPTGFLVNKKGKDIFPPNKFDLLNPNLTYNKRKELIDKINGLEISEEKGLIDAIHLTIKEYTERKSKDIYKMLGMDDEIKSNFLLAAGDGSGTAGLLGEVESGNVDDKGTPKGIGLFTYETEILSSDKKEELYPKKEPKEIVYTIGKNKRTNMHLSMWGFNYKTQTTVAITKGLKTYLFYGSKYTGELSPDPRFNNNEKTYKNHLKKLETEMIPEWEAEVYGEKGLEEKLKQLKIDKDELLLAIQKNEYEESNLRVLRQKKNQKKIKQLGNTLDRQHKELGKLNNEIIEAEEEFKVGKKKLDEMKYRLAEMKENLGEYEQKYWKVDHLKYQFQDGTIFNLKTQDLIFEKSDSIEEINIKLLAIGSNPMSYYADEVQLNVGVTEKNIEQVPVEHVELYLQDGFKPDRFRLNELRFGKEADYIFSKMIKHIIDEQVSLDFDLYGMGIGKKNKDGDVVSAEKQNEVELKSYPGETNEEKEKTKESLEFKDLRFTFGSLKFSQKDLVITLKSFTDPVKSNVLKRSNNLTSFSNQHPKLTGNQMLSALRTFAVYEQLIKKMTKISDQHLKNDKEKRDKYRKYFKHKLEHIPVKIGDFRLEYDIYKKG